MAKALPRSAALDLLRGAAILAMVAAAALARSPLSVGPHLPAWMHPAQFPPPNYSYEWDRCGLTWVDLIAPLFLFCMGAAIPISLGARLAAGTSTIRLVGRVLIRGAVLLAIAVYLGCLSPPALNRPPRALEWAFALAAFAALLLLLAPLPGAWSRTVHRCVRFAGLCAAASILLVIAPAPASGRRPPLPGDDYLIVLANVWTTAALLWLATRGRKWLLLIGFAATLALCLGHEHWWPTKWMWHWTRGDTPALAFAFFEPLLPYLARYARLEYQQYLLIVIPGVIAGEVLRAGLAARGSSHCDVARTGRDGAPRVDTMRFAGAACAVLLIVGVVIGVQSRWEPATLAFAVAGGGLGAALLARIGRPQTRDDRRRFAVFAWGGLWLIAGLALDAWLVGVRRLEPTLSYHLVSAGLCTLALFASAVLGEAPWARCASNPIAALGRYALLTYCALRGPGALLLQLAR
ncbi:MAG: DUF5009 domain-containing protein [Phycisphaerae bacterium]